MTRKTIVAMLMALALVVAACSSDDADTDTTTTVAGEDNATTTTAGTDSGDTTTTTVDPELPIDAPERTLVVAATGTPSGFDGDIFGPNMQNAVVNLNEPLVDYELAGTEVNGDEVRPRLAESWTVSDDGLTYTIKLREGVLSHLGNELTAEDVVWSYEKSIAQGRTGNFIRNVGNVDSIEATGTYEVQFTLTAPSPIFIRAITVYTPSIYDSTELKTHATDDDPYATEWLKSNFAGYGPYYVDQFTPGQQVIFKANPNYWDGVPYYTTIVYQAVPEPANRVALLTAEEVDYIEAPSQQQLVELSNNS
ncbi:ABC transporter substrate-binding protein, partial [Actinomycetota bacterium]